MIKDVEILKALGEPTRLRIMRLLLAAESGACGCELVDSLGIPHYNLTKHLDILINAGLVVSKKEGRWVYYTPLSERSGFLRAIYAGVLKTEDKIYAEDYARFKKRMALRTQGKCLLGIQNKKLVY